MSNQRRFSHDYGWVIVGLAFCSLAYWFGIRTSFSVFYVALSSEFSWQPGVLAGAQSMALISAMLSAPVLGSLMDRLGPRKIILPGLLMVTIGIALCATMVTLKQFYIYYGIIVGGAMTSIGVVTYSVVLNHWFVEKRGIASGIAVSGMGAGVLVLVPMVQYSITAYGWRNAFLLLSVLGAIGLLPATYCLLRQKKETLKPKPVMTEKDGLKIKTNLLKGAANAILPEIPMSSILKQAYFWHFILFAFFASIGVYIILVHSVKFLVDKGTDEMVAAMILAIVGAMSTFFRVFWGWMSDRISRELTYSIGSLAACLGIGCLLLRDMCGSVYFSYLFAILFGIGWGVTAPLVMASSADIFSGRSYGFIFGIIQSVINLAGALGSWLGGFIFGKYQSYQGAFQLAVLSFILSCIFIWKAAPRKKFLGLKKAPISLSITLKN